VSASRKKRGGENKRREGKRRETCNLLKLDNVNFESRHGAQNKGEKKKEKKKKTKKKERGKGRPLRPVWGRGGKKEKEGRGGGH